MPASVWSLERELTDGWRWLRIGPPPPTSEQESRMQAHHRITFPGTHLPMPLYHSDTCARSAAVPATLPQKQPEHM